jgi:hypothetical protein
VLYVQIVSVLYVQIVSVLYMQNLIILNVQNLSILCAKSQYTLMCKMLLYKKHFTEGNMRNIGLGQVGWSQLVLLLSPVIEVNFALTNSLNSNRGWWRDKISIHHYLPMQVNYSAWTIWNTLWFYSWLFLVIFSFWLTYITQIFF